MKRLLIVSLLTTALWMATPAQAYRFIEPLRMWDLENMPVQWYAPDPETADMASMPPGAALELIGTSFAHWWEDIPCSPLGAEYGGAISNVGEYEHDNRTSFYFEDPNGRLGSGILGACLTWGGNDNINHLGMSFSSIDDFDIIFNNGVNYGTPDDIYGGGCTSQTSFEAVSTHEIGHGYGVGHSCESDEACPDPLLRDAVMYWAIGSCETGRETPNGDDSAAINALYAIYTDFEANGDIIGEVPFDVEFGILEDLDEGLETYLWSFGDGSDPSAEAVPTHRYDEEGQYTVTLTVTGVDDDCGEFEDTVRKVGYVLACDVPEPEFSFTNLGSGEVQFQNITPTETFGCIHEYVWDLGDGTEISGFEPVHDYGHEGTWSVTLTASGPGGQDAFKMEVDVTRQQDPREDEPTLCHITSASPQRSVGSALSIAALVLYLLRRRR